MAPQPNNPYHLLNQTQIIWSCSPLASIPLHLLRASSVSPYRANRCNTVCWWQRQITGHMHSSKCVYLYARSIGVPSGRRRCVFSRYTLFSSGKQKAPETPTWRLRRDKCDNLGNYLKSCVLAKRIFVNIHACALIFVIAYLWSSAKRRNSNRSGWLSTPVWLH